MAKLCSYCGFEMWTDHAVCPKCLKPIDDKEQATQIVDALMKDMTSRKGLRQEWDEIDPDIQQEIRDEWQTKVEALL